LKFSTKTHGSKPSPRLILFFLRREGSSCRTFRTPRPQCKSKSARSHPLATNSRSWAMESDLRWCSGSSNNDWDLHAVVRFASCSGGSCVPSPRASDESFSCLPLPPPPPQKDDVTDATTALSQQLPIGPAIDDSCLQQAFFATPQSRNEAPAPPLQPPAAKLRIGGATRSKRKYVSAVRPSESLYY
jgi:hypothetical protein